MIAKLIAYGSNREEAIQRLIEAIDNYEIKGVATTLGFGKFVLQHEAFRSGQFDTHFVKNHFSPEMLKNDKNAEIGAIFALKAYLEHKKQLVVPNVEASNWLSR